MKRKIAAILAADVAGYSRLIALNEEETLARLADYREVFDDFVQRYGGRIFNTAGDSVMCEFDSAVEATRCAIDIQESLRSRDRDTPEDRKFQYRIGITIGDVVERGTDLLGDGVNIAARLEGLAEPGGICVSRSVHEAVANKISVPFHDIGLREVKNIPQPVHAFTVGKPEDINTPPPKTAAARKRAAGQQTTNTRILAAAAIAVCAVVIFGVIYMATQKSATYTVQTGGGGVLSSPSPNVIINGVPMNTPQATVETQAAAYEPTASFTRTNAGWSVSVTVAEPMTALYYRIGDEGDFRKAPTMPNNDPRTGKPMVMPAFQMQGDQGDTTIHIKYVRPDGSAAGPYEIPFAHAAALDTGQKSILEMTSLSWLAFNEDNPVALYYTHLVAFRCTIRAVMIGYDGEKPDRPLTLPPCDRKNPNEIPDGLIPILSIPASVGNVTAQLTYNDGSKSEIMTYQRPE